MQLKDEVVLALAREYERVNLKPPAILYVGRRDWFELQHHTDYWASGTHEAGRRREFMGLQVFCVDADNHLGVG